MSRFRDVRSGLVPGAWDVLKGEPADRFPGVPIMSGTDSFYEYMLKVPIGSCRYDDSEGSLCADDVTTLNDMLSIFHDVVRATPQPDPTIKRSVSHLKCFVPGLFALGSAYLTRPDIPATHGESEMLVKAEGLLEDCRDVYERSETGLGPESTQSTSKRIRGPYHLRPEYVESLFVMYRVTREEKYRDMGWRVFEALERFCKWPHGGYTGLRQVDCASSDVENRIDDQPSFFIAETLKYLLLLFAPPDYVSLDDFVFTTEAHPLRRRSSSNDVDDETFTYRFGADERVTRYAIVHAPFPTIVAFFLWLIVFAVSFVVLELRELRCRYRNLHPGRRE